MDLILSAAAGSLVGALLWEGYVRRWQRRMRAARSLDARREASRLQSLPWNEKLKVASEEMMQILEQLEPGTERTITILDPDFRLVHSSHTLWVFAKQNGAARWEVSQFPDNSAVMSLRVHGGISSAPSPVPDQSS